MGTQDSPAAQAQYPSRVKHAGDDASVPLQAEKQLWEESGRLFSDNQISVDAMRISPENHESTKCLTTISSMEALDEFLQVGLCATVDTIEDRVTVFQAKTANFDTYIFFRQFHSWSEFQITYDGFVALLNAYPAPSEFLYFVRAFGQKVRDVDTNVGGYAHRNSSNELEHGPKAQYDFSYLLRYPAKHGRTNTKMPWSLRQLSVHQTFHRDTKTSTWIFLQCPESIQRFILDRDYGAWYKELDRKISPFSLMGEILLYVSLEWRPYINELEAEIMVIDEKASFSKVGVKKHQHDYEIDFSNAQQLHGIKKRILKSEEAIKQAMEIAEGLQNLHVTLHKSNIVLSPQCDNLTLSFNRFRNYHRTLRALADLHGGLSKLVFGVLEHRNKQAMYELGETLNKLTVQSNKDQAATSDLSKKMQRDSRSMRALTSAALVYMPASLLAAIFNSNLIQLPTDEVYKNSRHATVTPQIWVFLIMTMFLTIVTMLGVSAWSKWTSRYERMRTTTDISPP